MKTAGILILVAGMLMTLYTGFTYVTREKVVDLGEIEITKESPHSVYWEPYVGVGMMAIGGAVLFFSRKK